MTTAADFKRRLADDPEQALTGWAVVASGAASVIWCGQAADGAIQALAAYEPPTPARTGVIYVLPA